MSERSRNIRLGATAALAAGALAVGVARHETGKGDSGVPVDDSKAKVTLELPSGPPTFKKGEQDGTPTLTLERDKNPRTVDIHETKNGGLVATDKQGDKVSMNLELPISGPNAVYPDLKPDSSEPSVEYTPPVTTAFVNSTEINGKIETFADEGNDTRLTIQQDGHGGLVADNEEGDPVQIDLHLPAPGPDHQPAPNGEHGPYDKNGNLTPKPGDFPGVPGGKNPTDTPIHIVQSQK